MMEYPGQIPPRPATHGPDGLRIEETAKRKRLLTGNWADDLEDELDRHIGSGSARRAAWGIADQSSNAFKHICSALSQLYASPPICGVLAGNADNLIQKNGLLDRGALWPMMQTVQELTLGLNECFVRIDINDKKDGLLFRVVTPDNVVAQSSIGDPQNPYYLIEYRLRGNDETKNVEWTADVFDLRDKNNPKYQVWTLANNGDLHTNVSKKYLGAEMEGTTYPYRNQKGEPFLPYSLYHAQINGSLFSPFENSELVSGSMICSVLYSALLHTFRDCSHPQRYIAGLQIAGTSIYDTDKTSRRAAIATDPASVLCFSFDPDNTGGQPMLGQWQPGGDPLKMLEAITIYERRLAIYMNINPSDIVKQSGDPRSGMAISLSQSAKRESQRRYAPIFRFSDIDTLEKSAMIANAFLGTTFPEEGYRIRYQAIPLSPEELKAQREDILLKLQAGLLSPISALMIMHPDIDEREARLMLSQIKRDRLEYGIGPI